MTDSAGIVPDTKDWTWVLERPCPECGLDSREISRGEVADRVRASAALWPEVLARADAAERPKPATWSPLEYAAHIRDVFRIFHERLVLMLTEDDPLFANWDQDETAVAERYGEQDPGVVGTDLLAAGETLAARFDDVSDEQWTRTGRRSDGARFTVETFSRYLLHDLIHHTWDVGAG